MQIMLDQLGTNFNLKAINDGNTYNTTSAGTLFLVQPGVYIVANKRTSNDLKLYPSKIGAIKITEFAAPKSLSVEPLSVMLHLKKYLPINNLQFRQKLLV